jgi:hypothetical protein
MRFGNHKDLKYSLNKIWILQKNGQDCVAVKIKFNKANLWATQTC